MDFTTLYLAHCNDLYEIRVAPNGAVDNVRVYHKSRPSRCEDLNYWELSDELQSRIDNLIMEALT